MTSSPDGGRRAAPGAHRAARRPRTRPRTRRGVRGLGLLAVAVLATGFGLDHPGLLGRSPDTVARDSTDAADAADPSPPTDALPGDDAPSPTSTPAPEPESSEDDTEETAPTRRPVPAQGDGTFRVAGGAAPAQDGSLTYTVEVEGGLPFGAGPTAAIVDRVLDDPRSWTAVTGQVLDRTATTPDFRILLASPSTTDELCAPLQTNGEVSCRNGDLVVLNARRWATGTPDYAGFLPRYRSYLVNHEVGHRLGFGHVGCPAPGEPAPVMLQQTYGLEGCTRNAWPVP